MFIDLCIHIDANTGFQFYGDMVIPDGYLFDLTSHWRFIKFGEVSSLWLRKLEKNEFVYYLSIAS